jgi:hypothetical protein
MAEFNPLVVCGRSRDVAAVTLLVPLIEYCCSLIAVA